jgi:hypothetical protein
LNIRRILDINKLENNNIRKERVVKMLPFLVYVEHRKSEYKWEMYMWMLWIKNRKKEFLEYRYVFLWDSFSLLKILENEAKKNNCWKDRIY